MNVTDIIIIYLACGAPFGVYQVTKDRPLRSDIHWASVASSFVLWPALALSLMFDGFLPSKDASLRIDRTRIQIEEIAFSGEPMSLLFEFREIFYRYTGLAEAMDGQTETPMAYSKMRWNRSDTIAAKCIARRNREKLEFHLARARNEFIDLISELASSNRQVAAMALEMATQFGDMAAVHDLATIRDRSHVPDNRKISKSRTRSTSAIN